MKTTCVTCGQSFEKTRSDQQFCSRACKQKSYREKRVETTSQEPIKKMTFRLSEYREFVEEYGWDREFFPFILFCFYRRLLPETLSGTNMIDAVSEMVPDLEKYRMRERAFIEFKHRFLSNEFDILE